MRPSTSHRYKGHVIYPTSWADSPGRWYVQTHHSPTGVPHAERLCPQFRTLALAKAHIQETIAEEAYNLTRAEE